MPLHIREMVLKTTLAENNAENGTKSRSDKKAASAINPEYIIAECMDRLMDWLREEHER